MIKMVKRKKNSPYLFINEIKNMQTLETSYYYSNIITFFKDKHYIDNI